MSASFFLVECGRSYDRLWRPIPDLALPFAVADLGKFYKFVKTNFVNPNIDLISTDLKVCEDNNFTFGVKSNILASIADFCNRTKSSSFRVFYYAGHGMVHNGELYLVPADFRRDLPETTGIALSSILQRFQGLNGENLVILDCCRQSARIEAMPTMSEFSLRLSERTHVVLGCSDGEACHESGSKDIKGGIFTAACLSAFESCDEGCNLLDFFGKLKDIQANLVTELVRDRSQVPRLLTFGGLDFPLGSWFNGSTSD